MNICFTGSAKIEGLHFERKHLIAFAEEKGHHVDKQVRAETSLLVAGEPYFKNGKVGVKKSQKIQMAKAWGISIVSPKDFLTQMGFL